VRTTAGSEIWQARVPTQDAQVWARLQEQGAILLGKHNLHEFAYGTTNDNAYYGAVHNPWDFTRTSGGSSGGSAAAVAANLSAFSIGTDTGGSIRIPAACTGVYGLKPTYGRVSVRGIAPLAFSLDHAGPLARSIRDIGLLMDVIAGYDPLDPASVVPVGNDQTSVGQLIGRPLDGLRVGYEDDFFATMVDAQIRTACEEALDVLQRAGATVVRVAIALIENVSQWQNETISAEAFAVHQERLDDPDAPFAKETRARLETGRSIMGHEYARAQHGRAQFKRVLADVFAEIDVLITPTLCFVAPVLAQRSTQVNGETVAYRQYLTRFTNPFNFSGYPALAAPFGLSADGLPISVQLVAPPFAEARLLQVGAILEAQRPFAPPPLFA